LVVYFSPLLSKALNHPHVRSSDGPALIYIIEDTTEGAFALFMEWMYSNSQTLNIKSNKPDTLPLSVSTDAVLEGSSFIQLWILADRLMIPNLQNTAMELILQMTLIYRTVWINEITSIYNNTSKNSPLRQVLMDQGAWKLNEESIKQNPDFFSFESLIDIACACRKLLTTQSIQPSLSIADYKVEEA